MTEKIHIRRADRNDIDSLAKVSWLSFHQAFADHPQNDPADMKVYMEKAFAPETLASEMADQDAIFLVAEKEDTIIGYAKLKSKSSEDGISAENPVELCRLYALQDHIGHGIGRALMNKCLELSKENRHDVMWLGVWEFNYRAQKFYEKAGFKKVGEHIFLLGSDPQTDWLMQISL